RLVAAGHGAGDDHAVPADRALAGAVVRAVGGHDHVVLGDVPGPDPAVEEREGHAVELVLDDRRVVGGRLGGGGGGRRCAAGRGGCGRGGGGPGPHRRPAVVLAQEHHPGDDRGDEH